MKKEDEAFRGHVPLEWRRSYDNVSGHVLIHRRTGERLALFMDRRLGHCVDAFEFGYIRRRIRKVNRRMRGILRHFRKLTLKSPSHRPLYAPFWQPRLLPGGKEFFADQVLSFRTTDMHMPENNSRWILCIKSRKEGLSAMKHRLQRSMDLGIITRKPLVVNPDIHTSQS